MILIFELELLLSLNKMPKVYIVYLLLVQYYNNIGACSYVWERGVSKENTSDEVHCLFTLEYTS